MMEVVIKNARTHVVGQAIRRARHLGFELNIDHDVPGILQEKEIVETFTTYGYEEDGAEIQRQLVIASLRG